MTIRISQAPSGGVLLPFRQLMRVSVLATAMIGLSACSSDSDDSAVGGDNVDLSGQYAYVATRAADYGSGRIDRLSLEQGNVVVGSYPGAGSNIDVDTDGVSPYQIGKFMVDSITRYDAEDTSIVDYQYSVKGDEPITANPTDLVFSGPNRAYLTRRSSNSLWIVDPAAETEEDFKLEEIDLSAYDTDLPDMTEAIIVDDKLFVLLERLQRLESGSQIPDKSAYVAVINTITNTEIDTGMGSDGLLGIELDVTNPSALQYNEETGLIHVVGRGNYFENEAITEDFHSGGVQSIDPGSYETTLILDDGSDAENEGYFVDLEIINAELGYLLTYAEFTVTTLRTFNPTSGELSADIIPGLDGVDITTLAQGPDNHLWIGINDDNPGFYRLDLSTGELAAERVATDLVPINVVFIDVPQSDS
ncbi:hypothetical protein ACUNV4_10545 [Granulosicoccus sp. 3-233]|uniref:hypothetical protein n=1 Tax=Granulosicoccus sp. 3-233 TaxID=3417969 RepID=UPI003D34C931